MRIINLENSTITKQTSRSIKIKIITDQTKIIVTQIQTNSKIKVTTQMPSDIRCSNLQAGFFGKMAKISVVATKIQEVGSIIIATVERTAVGSTTVIAIIMASLLHKLIPLDEFASFLFESKLHLKLIFSVRIRMYLSI